MFRLRFIWRDVEINKVKLFWPICKKDLKGFRDMKF